MTRILTLAALTLLAACGRPAPSTVTPVEPLEPPPPGEGFQVDEGSFAVDSGVETLYCKRFPIPEEYGSEPVFLRGVESQLPDMTHHFFMAYSQEPLAAEEPCGNEEPEQHAGEGKMIFLSGVGSYGYFLQDGYALYMDTGIGRLSTSHHVINFSDSPVDMYGRFNLYTLPAEEVHHPVNVMNCLQRDIWVAPGSTGTTTATCTAPFDLEMVILSSHAHQFLERFEMRLFDGQDTQPDPFYVSTNWDSPEVVALEDPLFLAAGQGITFTCHYRNGTDEWVTYGAGEYGEMCAIMSSYAFPSDRPHDVPPSLGAILFADGGSVELVDTTDVGGQF